MMGSLRLALLCAVALLFPFVSARIASRNVRSWCSGAADGDYFNPFNCFEYVTCSNEITYARPCPVCDIGEANCPHGYLVYNPPSGTCEYESSSNPCFIWTPSSGWTQVGGGWNSNGVGWSTAGGNGWKMVTQAEFSKTEDTTRSNNYPDSITFSNLV